MCMFSVILILKTAHRIYHWQWNILHLKGRDYLLRIIILKVSVMLNLEGPQPLFISNAHYFDHTPVKVLLKLIKYS